MLPFDLQTSLPEQRNSGRPHALVCYGFGNRQHKTNGSTKPNKHVSFLQKKVNKFNGKYTRAQL
ncbi:unnamed protein product, partial [Linum tenue]